MQPDALVSELCSAIRGGGDVSRCAEVLASAGGTATATANASIPIAQSESIYDYDAGLISPLMLAILLKRLPIVALLLERVSQGGGGTGGR